MPPAIARKCRIVQWLLPAALALLVVGCGSGTKAPSGAEGGAAGGSGNAAGAAASGAVGGSGADGGSGASGASGASTTGGSGGAAAPGGDGGTGGADAGGGGQGVAGAGGENGGGAPNDGGAGPGGGVAPVIAAGVRWHGRVDVRDPAAIKFAWSGSGFVGSFTGPTVSAKLKTVGGGDIYFQPVVDGKPGARFSVGSAERTVELATGLSAGAHRIELYRETEGKGFGYSVFSGFAAGTPGAPPAFSGRLIEVIGDSISAGFGNLGSETHPNYGPDPNGGCDFTTETESAYLAYGHVAARAVMADASVVAGSGWGIYSDNLGSRQNVMPSLFGNVLGEVATPAWAFAAKPQAVVINLGTNDASASNLSAEKFKPAYSAFIATVRTKYPDALVLCAVGSLMSGEDRDSAKQFIGEIVSDLSSKGDDKVKLLDLGTQDALKGTGCSWHPNVAENTRLAALLVAELKSSLAW